MLARWLVALSVLAVVAFTLPIGGCGDNDNSGPPLPCCPVCGDGVCSGDERPCSCPQDCGRSSCAQIVPTCGDGVCQREGSPAESHENCPADCPLRCRQCVDELQVYVNGKSSPGLKCPTGTTVAYRDGDLLACNSCATNADCGRGRACTAHCGPGCEHDTASPASCCEVTGCLDVVS